MPSWDIAPSGVQGVLKETGSVASAYEKQLQRAGTAMQTGASNTSSGLVAKAVAGFGEAVRGDIEFVVNSTGAVLTGAARAVNAYVAGDVAMAANAQRAAAAAPTPAPPGGGGGGRERLGGV